LPRGLGSGC